MEFYEQVTVLDSPAAAQAQWSTHAELLVDVGFKLTKEVPGRCTYKWSLVTRLPWRAGETITVEFAPSPEGTVLTATGSGVLGSVVLEHLAKSIRSEQEAIAKARETTTEGLIAELDGPEPGPAWRALRRSGKAVVAPLVGALPTLGARGQSYAIELLEEVGDARAASVLIPLVASEDFDVRIRAVDAVARLGAREAVPALQAADERAKRRGDRLDERERQGIRRALTGLGARHPVVPAFMAEHALVDDRWSWLPDDLPEIVEALAAARQVVLGWLCWVGPQLDTDRSWFGDELDWSLPWDQLVASARDSALPAAVARTTPPKRRRNGRSCSGDAVVWVQWVDESDR